MNELTNLTKKIIGDVQELIDLYKAEELNAESLLKMTDTELKALRIAFRMMDNAMNLAREQAYVLNGIDYKLDRLLEQTRAQ